MSAIENLVCGACVCLLACGWSCWAKGLNSTVHQEMLRKLQDPSYIATIRPPEDNEGPTTVEVDILVNSIGPVNDSDMTWVVSFYLREEWTDLRVKLAGHEGVVKLGEGTMDSIWRPDIFFSNSKEGLRHQLTVPNRLIYINVTTGRVLSSQRLTMVLNCAMDLVKFPHDHQTCHVVMESYSYTTDDLMLKWSSKRAATELHPTVYLPDFKIDSITTTDCAKTYAIGTFPCLQVTVKMHREIGYYICQTFLPTILIVILSWASFWIDHDAAPARVSVGLLTVLTITTQMVGSNTLLPRVPYIKAIDVWMAMNLVFVFAAYMEYPVVTGLSRSYRKADLRIGQQSAAAQESEKSSAADIPQETKPSSTNPDLRHSKGIYTINTTSPSRPSNGLTKRTNKPQFARMPSIYPPNLDSNNPGRQLDKKSRFLFPLAFAIFNLIYWIYYMV